MKIYDCNAYFEINTSRRPALIWRKVQFRYGHKIECVYDHPGNDYVIASANEQGIRNNNY
jgi:hypothetical protein